MKHTEQSIEFIDLRGFSWKHLKDSHLGSGTGFSLLRWFIPQQCDFQGAAIYLDVDMLVFSDILDLWNKISELNGASIACTYQKDKWFDKAPASSVMLIACQKAKEQWKYSTEEQIVSHLKDDSKRKKYIALMHAQYVNPPPIEIDINWNRFNRFVPGTKLLHYTVEPDQPWYNPKHPFKDLWRDYFVETLKEGLISREDCEKEIKRFTPAKACSGCRAEGLHPYWAKFLVHCVN